jgi:hypothetical protein
LFGRCPFNSNGRGVGFAPRHFSRYIAQPLKPMRRNIRKICKHITLGLPLTLVLIFSFSMFAFAQTVESEEQPEIVVPEQAMEQVVQRVLVYAFKPRTKPTVIYLAEQGIKQSWLPTIKDIEFRLLSIEEIQQKELNVYFFTKPDLSGNTYDIGFAFGDPTCKYLGVNWHFRISKQKIKLWQNGGVGGGCGGSPRDLSRNITNQWT